MGAFYHCIKDPDLEVDWFQESLVGEHPWSIPVLLLVGGSVTGRAGPAFWSDVTTERSEEVIPHRRLRIQ